MRKDEKGKRRESIRWENPDDAEFAKPLAPGDPSSLVAVDNPDDIEDKARRKREKKKP